MQPDNFNIPNKVGTPEVNPNVVAPSIDRLPPIQSPEAGLDTGAERHEQVAELSAAQADAASVAMPAAVLPQPTAVAEDTSATATPLVAANDDLIEKEWVDRAKEIVTNTPNDPHARSEKTSALRKDYLRKRYGKELGAAS